MKRLVNKRGSILVGVAALVVATGSAMAAGSGSAIHACAKKSNGTLRLASRCKHSENAVSWNLNGVPGPQGPVGMPGAQGTPGVAGGLGPSDGFTRYSNDAALPGVGNPGIQLGAVTLPAGDFMVFARMSVHNGVDVAEDVTCSLSPPPNLPNEFGQPRLIDQSHIHLNSGDGQSVTMLGPLRTAGGGDVTLGCFNAGITSQNGTVQFTDIQLSAIQVGTLHSS
ncbi:MAG: hypothetical protein ACTHMY_00050 [Solirubrobacteraceae bacterium]